jgi:hypothetical protein
MFISSLPSSRAHFPYQAGLCGNRSPPDPLSLSARATCEPPHHRPALAHPSRCCRPGHCLGLHPDVRLTGQPDPPPLFSSTSCHAPHQPRNLFPRTRAKPECVLVAATTPSRRYRVVSNQAGHHFYQPSRGTTFSPPRAPLRVTCLQSCCSSWAEQSSLHRDSPSAATQVRLLLLVAIPGRAGRPPKWSCLMLLLRVVAAVRPPSEEERKKEKCF